MKKTKRHQAIIDLTIDYLRGKAGVTTKSIKEQFNLTQFIWEGYREEAISSIIEKAPQNSTATNHYNIKYQKKPIIEWNDLLNTRLVDRSFGRSERLGYF